MVSQHQVVRNFNGRVQPTPVPSDLRLACVPLEFPPSSCLQVSGYLLVIVKVKQLPIAQNIYNGGDKNQC